MGVSVVFPDELLVASKDDRGQFARQTKIWTLGHLYEQGKISSGLGARVLGCDRWEFYRLLTEHGFSVKVEIEPHEWEKDAILAVAYPDAATRRKRIDPSVHFPLIMDHVKQDAAARYGQEVDVHFGSSFYGVSAPHQP